MLDLKSVTDHFYAIIPNGDGYKVDWATKVSRGIYRAPACNDDQRKVVFGLFDPLELALSKVRKLQEIHKSEYDVVVYRRSENDPYVFIADHVA